MIRLMTILIWAVFSAGVAAAEGPWAGDWQLTWGNGGALVRFEQDGDAVSGSFGKGQIRATVHDNRLDGQILYNGETEVITATLSADGESFAGTTETGDWLSGMRIAARDRQLSSMPTDLSSPRAAMRSFLLAGNLAQANKSYALASALEAVDFGGDPGWGSREQRFGGVQELFQLIDRATFPMSLIPDTATGTKLTLSLPELDSNASIAIDMQRGGDGGWRILMPPPDKLRAALDSGKKQTADGFRQLQSPRDTLRAFLDGMENWSNGGQADAIATLDLSHVPEVLRTTEGDFVAQYLVRILNQVGHHTLQGVPNSGASREPFVLFELPAGRIAIEPVGTGDDTRWKFSADTVRNIRDLYRAAEELPSNEALDRSFIPYSPMFALRDGVKHYAPFLIGSLPGPGHLEYWQLLGSLLAVTGMVISTLVLRRAFLWVLMRPLLKRHVGNPRRLALGLAMGLSFVVGSRFIFMVGLPAVTRQFTVPVLGTLLLVIVAYALWQLVVFILSVLQEYAEKTDTAFDNILLTFAAGVAKLSIVAGSVLSLSYLWSLPTSGLLAGLGISGLAVAFASKETLSNIFGAGILLGDRPFRKGDRIIAGDVNGWVESVGLRSTRIRTVNDSLLVVPNGKLADMSVNNLGARRRRALSTTIAVTGGATPDALDAFIRGIRERMALDPIFDPKSTEVRVARIFVEGIDIEISGMLETRSGSASRDATHRLYLDTLRLAESLGLKLGRATEMAGAPARAAG